MTTNEAPKTPAALAAGIVIALKTETSVTDALKEVLVAFNLRAIGLWKVVGSELQQCGYVASSQMDPSVARDFLSATHSVPLSAGTLAIVRSVLDQRPIAAMDNDGPQLAGSASWLRRFGARQSLSCPVVCPVDSALADTIRRESEEAIAGPNRDTILHSVPKVLAAFAAAAEHPFTAESPLWKSLVELATELGRNWPAER